MSNTLLASGMTLQGRYAIERLIAQGGMGAVYQATDQRLGSAVALKQIIVSDPRMHRAFEREARLLAGLRHPVLPVVSDYFSDEQGSFLVMQYIAGDDMGTMLSRQSHTFTTASALPWVLQWLEQLLDVLDYLHLQTPPVIHRDIKPQNLKLTPRGEIVLLDFGLAKGAVNSQRAITSERSLRAYTTQYAPFEQIQGTGTDARSDIYSLAATLYHILAGEPPADALTRAAVVLGGKPDPLLPLNKVNPHVSPSLAAVFQQALSNGMSKRFGSASAMRLALQAIQQSGGQPGMDSSGQKTMIDQLPASNGGQQTLVMPGSDLSAARLHESPAPAQMRQAITETPPIPTVIVAPGGRGHYQSISAAIAHAQPGTRILVRPGHYAETLTLDRSLELSGDGPAAEIIIEGVDASAIKMQTDYALVRGLTLRGRSTHPTSAAVVDISQGRLVLEDCDISTDTRIGVAISGHATNPVLWRCRIHGASWAGVMVYEAGRGTIEECDIFENGNTGVGVRTGGNPTLRRCKVYHNEQDGIYIADEGHGLIDECDIFENKRAGIEIKDSSNPFVRQCKIAQHRQGYGIYVASKGEGLIEACDISANGRAGVAIVQGGNPLIRNCLLHNAPQRGVFVSEHGKGTLERCHLNANGKVGVEIRQGGLLTVRQCSINSHTVAVWVHKKGAARIERCDLTNNARGAWLIEDNCQVSRSANKE